MVEEDGERLRRKSRVMMAIFSDQQLHQHYLGGLVDFLKRVLKQRRFKSKTVVVCKMAGLVWVNLPWKNTVYFKPDPRPMGSK